MAAVVRSRKPPVGALCGVGQASGARERPDSCQRLPRRHTCCIPSPAQQVVRVRHKSSEGGQQPIGSSDSSL